MTLAEQLARFVHGLNHETIPEDVQTKARACFLNGYGIALGCHPTPYHHVARSAALDMDGLMADGATILTTGEKTSVAGAVLVNGALSHGRAQEDTCGAAHLGAVIIPLLTAMAETGNYSLKNFLPALVAGYEVGGLLEKAYAGITTPSGFRASTVYGTAGAAAAASRLMELEPDRIQAALANAVSFSGGLLQSFADGTDEWRYQVGTVANLGRTAAGLARAGSVSAPNAFEGPVGFVKAFTKTDCDVQDLAARLGREWNTHRVAFKPFPVCAFNQTPVTAGLELRKSLDLDHVESIDVRMNSYECGYAGMDAIGPFTSISGTLMSIPFCIANTLLYGAPTMAQMTTYDDAQVQGLINKITLTADDSIKSLCCRIDVKLKNGEVQSQDQIMTPADYAYPWDEVSAMVRRIGQETDVPMAAYDQIEAFVSDLPEGDISTVTSAFAMMPVAQAAE
jgi:2-methylcitrate dehydratase PrpD